MKNRLSKILLLGGVFLLGATSCSDSFLEEKKDYSIMSSQDVFSDPVQAKAVFGQIYKKIMEKNVAPIYSADLLMRQNNAQAGKNSFLTEELPVTAPTGSQIGAPGLGDSRYLNGTGKTTFAGNHIAGTFYWNGGSGSSFNSWSQLTLYPTIYYINEYIKEINAARSLYNHGPNFWDHLYGQAVFARAWLFFDAVKGYGGVPYYNTEFDTPNNDDRSERLSMDECFDRICADFKSAADALPATWDADNYGRWTSVAALAMISRVRLYAASPVFNANWDDASSKRWKAALDATLEAKAAADNAGYTGVTSINEWDKAFYEIASHAKEAIIAIPKSSNSEFSANFANKWEYIIRPSSVTGGTGPGVPAPKQMIDLFPLKNGQRAIDKDGNAINGYDAEKFYLNRDPRFYRTFAFSGCQWPGTTSQIWLYAYQSATDVFSYTDGTTGNNMARQKSKALVWKMANPNVADGSVQYSGASILEYRYGELLLNLAECYAATGDLGSCQNTLNQVRSRVGAQSVSAFTTKYQAIEAVLYERRVELAYEGKRPWDTRRWLLYEGGAGFDPTTATNAAYNPDEVWGTGWKIYDGKNGRPNYTKADNILTKLGLNPISGTRHSSEIWAYELATVQGTDDPISSKNVTPIKRDDDAGRDAALATLTTFYNSNLATVNPIEAPMNISYGMGYNNSTNDQAKNFLFTHRGWFYVWPIHYNQRIQEANNSWITQNVGWNIYNVSDKVLDGTYEYCTVEN